MAEFTVSLSRNSAEACGASAKLSFTESGAVIACLTTSLMSV